jgi:hypothetical protein
MMVAPRPLSEADILNTEARSLIDWHSCSATNGQNGTSIHGEA